MSREVTKRMITETGHRLINYDGKCAHLHGHRYVWEVTVESGDPDEDVDSRGMVIDFKDLKFSMKESIEPFDHAMVLHVDDPLIKGISPGATLDLLRATNEDNPRLIIMDCNPTAENMAKYVAEILDLPEHLFLKKIVIWETEDSFVTWYS